MKKRNIRRFLIFIAMTMFLLAGCGGGKEEDGRGDVIEEEPLVNAEDFYGVWVYESGDGILSINGDGTLEWINEDGTSDVYTYYIEDGALFIEDSDLCYMLDGEGGLIDSDGDVLFAYDPSAAEGEPAVNAEDFFGYWKYTDEEYWVYFSGEGTYETYNEEGSHQSGNYTIGDDGSLYVNEQDWSFTLTGDGSMVDSFGDELVVSEAPDFLSSADMGGTYIESQGIQLNYELNQGDVILSDGAYNYEYGSDGYGYETSPLQVSINLENEVELDNGYIQRTYSTYLGVIDDEAPYFSNGVRTGCTFLLYDGLNGTFLPDVPFFESGSEGSYYFEFETSEGWVDLYLTTTLDMRDDVEGYTYIFYSSTTVTAPGWYDDLVMTVVPQPETYEEREEYYEYLQGLDTFILMDNQPYDFENGINCAILQ